MNREPHKNLFHLEQLEARVLLTAESTLAGVASLDHCGPLATGFWDSECIENSFHTPAKVQSVAAGESRADEQSWFGGKSAVDIPATWPGDTQSAQDSVLTPNASAEENIFHGSETQALGLSGAPASIPAVNTKSLNSRAALQSLASVNIQSSEPVWSGDIPDGTVWASNQVQRITGDARVPSGTGLTIQPGAIIKFNSGTTLKIAGTLHAQGTVAAPIIFTALRDDTAGGDTDKNGPTNGSNGEWNRIEFAAGSSGNIFDHVEIRYGGGYDASAAVQINSAALTLTNSTIRNSYRSGLRLVNSNPTLTNNTFQDNFGTAASMDLASSPAINGVTMRNNGLNGLAVDGGTLPANNAWDDPDIVYQVLDTVKVPAGKQLTVSAGQIIKTLTGAPMLVVQGSLAVNGTATQPVIFTSLRDDSAGGDTNNDNVSAGSNGEWNRIEFASGSTDNVLNNVEVRYAGGYDAQAAIWVNHASLTMSGSTVRNSYRVGMRITGANPILTNNTFAQNLGPALSMDVDSSPVIRGATVKNNGMNGLALDVGIISTDNAWDNPDVVYQLTGTVTVPKAIRLAIGAGQIVKVTTGAPALVVQGTLAANGTTAQPIIFTSFRDDSAGGDTNNDNLSNGSNGEWNRLEFAAGSSGNVLDHVEVRYGGGYDAASAIQLNDAALTLTNSVIRNSFRSGLRLVNSKPTLTNVTFQDNFGAAASMDLASSPAINGVTMQNNGLNGLAVDGGTLPSDNAWDDPDIVYQTTNTVTVPVGKKLTIAAGQIIKSFSGAPALFVQGTLAANGTETRPVILTSLRDDSAGGDTNNDKVSVGSNGEWNRIEFASGSIDNVLNNVEVRYGGGFDAQAAIWVNHAPLNMIGSTVRNSFHAGLRIAGAAPTLTTNLFKDNFGSALSMDLASSPVLSGNKLANNGVNGLVVDGGILPEDTAWNDPDIVYQVSDVVTIPAGKKLSIAAGQIIKTTSGGPLLLVNGTLDARGTEFQPVIFTSRRDDSAGGDTNNDGKTSGSNGEWNRIEFARTSTANVLDHVEFRYGGGYDGAAALLVNGGTLNLTSSEIRFSFRYGLRVQDGTVLGEGNNFQSNINAAISSDLKSHLALNGSTFNQNGVDGLLLDGGALPGNLVLESQGLTHFLAGDVSIPQGLTLRIAPGAIVSAQDNRNFTGPGAIINAGQFLKSSGFGTSGVAPDFTNTGTVEVEAGTLNFGGLVTIDEKGTLTGRAQGTIAIRGSLVGNTEARAQYPLSTVLLSGNGTAASPQLLEVMGNDLGSGPSGFEKNFVFYSLRLGSGTRIRLVDNSDNSAGSGTEALYVNNLVVPSGTTLDLNGLNVYARILQNSGAIIGGTINVVANGGAMALDTPTPGRIAAVGELNDWTFSGRKGDSITITVATGAAASPAPLPPELNFAEVRLVDSNRTVLGKASSTTGGALLTLADLQLPNDGTYHVEIAAPAAQSRSTGNYVLTAWDATVRSMPLTLNQPVTSRIDGPYRTERWTFAGAAGQLIQFKLINASSSALQFDLTGPNGFAAFTGLTASSGIVTLPANGTYALTARGIQNQTGAYAFSVDQAAATDLVLDVPFAGTLAGSGQTQLFRVSVPEAAQLQIDLQDSASADHNELYIKFGAAPTRGNFQYRSTTPAAANQQVNIPSAAPGTWYVLVFSESVPKPGTFTLVAKAAKVFLTSVTPDHAGNGADATLTLNGLGFDSTAAVTLIAANGTAFPASTTQVNSPTQIIASLKAGVVPPGTYSAKVVKGDGQTALLPNALRIVAGGAAHLTVNLIVPNPIGFHVPATIYVQYRNDGEVAMAAPIFAVTATQNGQAGALLTLDASRQAQGFWTSATPDGFSQTVQFLGGGATPGVLQPGEAVEVPVYYAGWLTGQWDFSRPPIIFSVGAAATDNPILIDWDAMKDGLRPVGVNAEAWSALFPSLKALAGSTYGQYVRALDDAAAYLSSLDEKVTDIGSLWGFLMQEAAEFSPVLALATAVDAEVRSPGLGLSFTRSFPASLLGRFEMGPFGRGWVSDWQQSLAVASDGTVVISAPGIAPRRFQPDQRGGYFKQPGDHGEVTALGAGTFRLREESGVQYVFQADGKLGYREDSNGTRITAGYVGGRLAILKDSSGASLEIAYNAAGLINRITDSLNRTTSYTYDAANQHLLSTTTYDGLTTVYAYNSTGVLAHSLQSTTLASGVREFFSYDSLGRLAAVNYAGNEGGRISFDRGPGGQVVMTDSAGASTKFSFDQHGIPVKVEDALHRTIHYAFDNNFNLVQLVDPAGQNYTFAYDDHGNVVRRIDPLGHTTSYSYSTSLSRISSITDANGATTQYERDAEGNLVATTYPDGSRESLAYDAAGNATQWINRRGNPVNYAYDSAGRLLSRSSTDGSSASYSYDARGNLIATTDSTGVTNLIYDTLDRLVEIRYPNNQSLRYSYDAVGRRTKMTDQDGFILNYAYDALGRLNRITDGAGGNIDTYSYDGAGRLSREEKGNGTTSIYKYDLAGQLVGIVNRDPSGTVNSRFDYTYDQLGQRTSESSLNGRWAFECDAIGQLTRAVFTSTNGAIPNQDLTYVYDAVGNRIRAIRNGETTAYTTNALDEYTAAGDVTFGYDPDGNLVFQRDTSGITSFVYDNDNRLISVVQPDGTNWSYQYNALGSRVATTRNGQRTGYIIDPFGLGNVVGQYASNGSLMDRYVHGLGLETRISPSGSMSFYDYNALGTTVGLSSTNGTYVNTYFTLPFGENVTAHESFSNPFTFGGEWGVMTDPAAGNYMRNRFYRPDLGRFSSQDPIGQVSGDTNLYRYAQNSPFNYNDPTGLATQEPRSAFSRFTQAAGGVLVTIGAATGYFVAYSVATGAVVIGGPVLTVAVVGGVLLESTVGGLGGIVNIVNAFQDRQIDVPTGAFELAAWAAGNNPSVRLVAQAADAIFGVLANGGLSLAGRLFNASSALGLGLFNLLNLQGLFNQLFGPTQSVNSHDPNDKTGPAGSGEDRFISTSQSLPFRIDFENDPVAAAPAQRVLVTDHLDSNLDWNSFELTEFGFGDRTFAISPGTQHYQTTLSMTQNSETFEVTIEAGLHADTGEIFVIVQSIDPKTSLPPDVLTGFLPPEDGTGRGQGHFNYIVHSKAGLSHGTIISNQAAVVFDANEPILTSRTRHTIDAAPPQITSHTINGGRSQRSRLDRIDFKFVEDTPVAASADSIQLVNQGTGQPASFNGSFSYDPTSKTGTLRSAASPSLPDGNYTARLKAGLVTDAGGLPLANDYSLNFFVLRGDVNGDRTTNDLDLYRAWQNQLKAPAARDLNEDLNGDGQVNPQDVTIVQSNYLAKLPPGPGGGLHAETSARNSGSPVLSRSSEPAILNVTRQRVPNQDDAAVLALRQSTLIFRTIAERDSLPAWSSQPGIIKLRTPERLDPDNASFAKTPFWSSVSTDVPFNEVRSRLALDLRERDELDWRDELAPRTDNAT